MTIGETSFLFFIHSFKNDLEGVLMFKKLLEIKFVYGNNVWFFPGRWSLILLLPSISLLDACQKVAPYAFVCSYTHVRRLPEPRAKLGFSAKTS